jgi:hypothetical protein
LTVNGAAMAYGSQPRQRQRNILKIYGSGGQIQLTRGRGHALIASTIDGIQFKALSISAGILTSTGNSKRMTVKLGTIMDDISSNRKISAMNERQFPLHDGLFGRLVGYVTLANLMDLVEQAGYVDIHVASALMRGDIRPLWSMNEKAREKGTKPH